MLAKSLGALNETLEFIDRGHFLVNLNRRQIPFSIANDMTGRAENVSKLDAIQVMCHGISLCAGTKNKNKLFNVLLAYVKTKENERHFVFSRT